MMQKTFFYLILIASVLTFSTCTKDDAILEYDCEEWTTDCSDQSIALDATKSNRKVLIIGIDGFRADAMQESITPFMFSLSQNANTYYTDQNHVQKLTFSGPNWGSLCTGVDLCKHNITTNDFEGYRQSQFPHFYEYVESAYPNKNTVSFANWTPVNTYMADGVADLAPTESANDNDIFLQARNALVQGVPLNPDFLFLHFDELDGAGHSYGFHPDIPEYISTLGSLDYYADSLYAIVETKRANGEDWLFCIVSDHGGEGTSHGGLYNDEDVRHTIMFMNSPNESFNNWHTSSQVDLAPTVLDFLGIQSAAFDCYTDGISILSN